MDRHDVTDDVIAALARARERIVRRRARVVLTPEAARARLVSRRHDDRRTGEREHRHVDARR